VSLVHSAAVSAVWSRCDPLALWTKEAPPSIGSAGLDEKGLQGEGDKTSSV
jgi:hypothetical protein